MERVVGSVADRVTPGMDRSAVVELWLEDPDVAANIKRGMKQEIVEDAADVMLRHANEGRDAMVQETVEHLGMHVRFRIWKSIWNSCVPSSMSVSERVKMLSA